MRRLEFRVAVGSEGHRSPQSSANTKTMFGRSAAIAHAATRSSSPRVFFMRSFPSYQPPELRPPELIHLLKDKP